NEPLHGDESPLALCVTCQSSQIVDGFVWVIGGINGRTSNKYVSSGFCGPFNSIRRHSPVNLQRDRTSRIFNGLACASDRWQHDIQEGLPAETWFDRHQ